MNLKKFVFLLGVSATALFAAPQLQLSTTAIGPVNIATATNAATQTITATNTGNGALNLGVTSSATWLVPSVSNGTILVAFNTSTLAAGAYTGFVDVTSPGAIDAPQNISVTIQVGGVPNTVELYAAPGGVAVSQAFNTQSRVNAQVSTVSGGPWLSVSLNAQGSFVFFYPYSVNATPQAGQGVGDYTGTATLSGGTAPGDNKTIGVLLHLTSSPIVQFGSTEVSLFGAPGGTKTTQTIPITNAGLGSLAITGATGSASWLTATAASATSLAVTADPTGLTAGTYRANVTLQSNAANTTASLPVTLTVLASNAPVLNVGGVVDNVFGTATLAPGEIAAAYGILLAGPTPTSASSLPLSTSLGGVSLSVNGVPAPVYYTSTGQIDFQIPSQTPPGPAVVSVSYNGVPGNSVSANISANAPRILRLGIANYGIVVNNSDQSLVIPVTAGLNSHPAKRGDALIIYAIGLGATSPVVADGAASPSVEPLARTPEPQVTFGGGFQAPVDGQVLFSGLTPGFVGLYQVNVIVPPDCPINDELGLQIRISGVSSLPVRVAISN